MGKIGAVLAALFAVLLLAEARADDDPALPDGGSIVTTTDGGSTVTVDLGARGAWTMALRCEGAQSTRYRLCASSSCPVTAHNQLLDLDQTQDFPINQTPGVALKRYLTLRTDDGGVPFCKVQQLR